MNKKVMAMLLALMMVISIMPVSASAAENTVNTNHIHVYEYFVSEAATCEKGGLLTWACVVPGCDVAYSYATPAVAHTWTTHYEMPTCTKEGTYQVVCTKCDKVLVEQSIPVALHQLESKFELIPATCTKGAHYLSSTSCKVCDYVSAIEYSISEPTGHTWENGVCTVCGEKDPSVPEEPEHKCFAETNAVDNEDLLTHSIVCAECGEFWKNEAHNWNNGVCVDCGAKTPFENVPETHKCFAETKAVANKDGLSHSIVCAECGEFWKNEAHNWADGVCADCGAEIPFESDPEKPEVEEECEAILAHKWLKPGQKCACCDFVGQGASDDDTSDDAPEEEECEAILAHKWLKPGQKCACCDFVGQGASDDDTSDDAPAEEECKAILAHKWLKAGQKCAFCDFVGQGASDDDTSDDDTSDDAPAEEECKAILAHKWLKAGQKCEFCDFVGQGASDDDTSDDDTSDDDNDSPFETAPETPDAGEDSDDASDDAPVEEECSAALAHKFLNGRACKVCGVVY